MSSMNLKDCVLLLDVLVELCFVCNALLNEFTFSFKMLDLSHTMNTVTVNA